MLVLNNSLNLFTNYFKHLYLLKSSPSYLSVPLSDSLISLWITHKCVSSAAIDDQLSLEHLEVTGGLSSPSYLHYK